MNLIKMASENNPLPPKGRCHYILLNRDIHIRTFGHKLRTTKILGLSTAPFRDKKQQATTRRIQMNQKRTREMGNFKKGSETLSVKKNR